MRLIRLIVDVLTGFIRCVTLWSDRIGDRWVSFWEQKIFPKKETWIASPYSSSGGFAKHIAVEIRSLPQEIWILLGSIMSGVGLISLLGYQANGPLVEFLVLKFGETSHTVWNLTFHFLPIEFSEFQAKILSINALAICIYLRTIYVSKREGQDDLHYNSIHNQQVYLTFFWTLATIFVAAIFSLEIVTQIIATQAVTDLSEWRRYVAVGSAAIAAFALCTVAMWGIFLVYFLTIFQSQPIAWVRTLAGRRPVVYAALNLAIPPATFISLSYAIPFTAQWVPQQAVQMVAAIIVWILFLHIFSVFLSSLTFPRVFFALIFVVLGLLFLDNVLP